MGLSASKRGIRGIVLPQTSRHAVEARLRTLGVRREASGAVSLRVTRDASRVTVHRLLRRAKVQLLGFLQGRRRRVELPLDLEGSPFQRRVWLIARRIPFGRVRSYRWVAVRLGGARYARAVGHALGANPVPIAVPCHRVVAQDGSLGGFSCGLSAKRRLLALESVKKSESRKS